MHVLAPLQNHRLETESEELEGCEHSCRTGSYHDYRSRISYVFIFAELVFSGILISLVGFDMVYGLNVAARVDRAAGNAAYRVCSRHRRLV